MKFNLIKEILKKIIKESLITKNKFSRECKFKVIYYFI